MNIKVEHIGYSRLNPTSIIEVTIEGQDGSIISEDVTSLSGKVNESFIDELRRLADALELQNSKVESFKQLNS